MTYYAFLNKESIVTEVILGVDKNQLIENKDAQKWYAEFKKQTCIIADSLLNVNSKPANVGYVYFSAINAFIEPKPFDSWTLDNEKCQWVAPEPYPLSDLQEPHHVWNEPTLSWVEITGE
jgi:hypothetical protein